MPPITPQALRALRPGGRIWHRGVGIYKTLEGELRYYIRFTAHLPDGSSSRLVEHVKNATSVTQARAALEVRKAEVFQGTWSAKAPAITVREFSETFLEAKGELKSVDRYRSQLKRLLLPYFGEMTLTAVKKSDCDAYGRYRRALGVKAVTVRGELACLRSLFSEAVDRELVTRNPAVGLDLEVPKSRRGRALTAAELEVIRKDLETRKGFLRPLFWTLCYMGMRITDACELRWSQLHGALLLFDQNKTDAGVRMPLPKKLVAELERWRPLCPSDVWMFPHPQREGPMTRYVAYFAWTNWMTELAIARLTPHDMRRTVVTKLRARGASNAQVQAVTGHASSLMLDAYERPEDETLRTLVEDALDPQP